MEKQMQILIAWEGKLLPLYISHEIPQKLMEDSQSTDDGLIGQYFHNVFREASKAINNAVKQDTKLVRWGFKVEEVSKEEGHSTYKLVDDPLKDDSGNPV